LYKADEEVGVTSLVATRWKKFLQFHLSSSVIFTNNLLFGFGLSFRQRDNKMDLFRTLK